MRKLILALSLSLISFAALAEDSLSVKITSFLYTGPERKVAEICGTVTGSTAAHTHVQVTVDERSKRPGHYSVLAGPNGKFCTVVVSYYGTAIAEAQ